MTRWLARGTAVLILLLGCSTSASAQPAPSLPQNPDQFRAILKKAEAGDSVAQRIIGLSYLTGRATVQSDGEGIAWLSKASQAGDTEASAHLGLMAVLGRGVRVDVPRGVELIRASASAGDLIGASYLGMLMHDGTGMPRDPAGAAPWLRKAAESGLSGAQNFLGTMYYWGDGVEKDYLAAWKWYSRSAQQHDARGEFGLAAMYHFAVDIAGADPRLDQFEAEFVRFGSSSPAAGERSRCRQDYEAHVKSGRTNEFSCRFRDIASAAKWYGQAAERGDRPARVNLGVLYLAGQGAPQDYQAALKQFTLAANAPPSSASLDSIASAVALANLGSMYLHGWGLPLDMKKSAELFRTAHERMNDEKLRDLFKAFADRAPDCGQEICFSWAVVRPGNRVEVMLATAGKASMRVCQQCPEPAADRH